VVCQFQDPVSEAAEAREDGALQVYFRFHLTESID
jgi:hypothetical protein